MTQTENLGRKTNIEVIRQLVPIKDLLVVDAGCGALTFTRHLADLGARVLAIDPDPIQAELNRTGESIPGIEFVETSAEQIPVESHTVDGLFFSYSLHHIPQEIYPEVFKEVLRVLKPDGFLYVLEPMGCPLNDVTKLFHDEDVVRQAAQEAIEQLAIPAFDTVKSVTYHNIVEYDSYEAFAENFSGRTFNAGYTEADVRRPAVKEAFERLGGLDHRFESPKHVMLLRGMSQ